MDTALEWDLVRQCRRGSAAAYEPLVRHYERPAFAIARALLGDDDEAADAVQDAFIRAYNTLGRLRPGSGFGPWLRTILRNACLDRIRRARRHETWDADTIDTVAAAEATADEVVIRSQLTATLHEAMDTLSAEHRTVLVLKEMDGLSYAEISVALAVPPGTVASRLYHARAALKQALLSRGVTEKDMG